VAARLPVDTRNMSLDFVVKTFLDGAEREDAWRHPLWLGSVNGSGADPLHPDLRREQPLARVLAPALQAYARHPGAPPLQRLSYQYCKTYLAEDILHKLDRASMAVSLEARPPFLDRPLVELVARLPVGRKLGRTGTSKVVLRRAFAARLPPAVLRRRKKGFGIPIATWLKGPLSHLLSELLGRERLAAAGYFQPAVVERLIADHRAGRKDNRKVLWTLLSFELWRERYGIGARR
jgi:asparagine synthase (glutamine-hydrolysing)